MGFCLIDVAVDTRAEGRHPPPWLLLPWRRRRGWHYCKCVVWAWRHSVSSSPRPAAELLGTGDDNNATVWIQFVSKFCHVIVDCLPPGISLSGGGKQIHPPIFPRGHRQAVPSSIPAPSQYQSGEIDSPQREREHVEPANICSISIFWLLPCRWRWRIQTQSASRSLPRLRISNVCYSPEKCCSSLSDTGITSDPWSSASLSASGGHDCRSIIKNDFCRVDSQFDLFSSAVEWINPEFLTNARLIVINLTTTTDHKPLIREQWTHCWMISLIVLLMIAVAWKATSRRENKQLSS